MFNCNFQLASTQHADGHHKQSIAAGRQVALPVPGAAPQLGDMVKTAAVSTNADTNTTLLIAESTLCSAAASSVSAGSAAPASTDPDTLKQLLYNPHIAIKTWLVDRRLAVDRPTDVAVTRMARSSRRRHHHCHCHTVTPLLCQLRLTLRGDADHHHRSSATALTGVSCALLVPRQTRT